ncbi:MAG: phosphoglucosamine mutase [Bacteroidetes bacterium]|nr:MAG: phosphoglucosamine mutase [Bacteroidota bacterium]
MTLIKSISGIRGTIGGKTDVNLTPLDIVKFTAAFGTFLQRKFGRQDLKIAVGRDARISGEMVQNLVVATLQALGIDVVLLGLSTTPTVEVAVPAEKAQGGIILTASHNPVQWNALKLLNEKGEFISAEDGSEVLSIAGKCDFSFAEVFDLGKITPKDYLNYHIQKIIQLPLVDTEAIEKAGLTVAVDAVNSSGGVYVPALLEALGVKKIIPLYCEPTGKFPHNPEPLPENLTEISEVVRKNKADLGIVVDPDVDRLALICEDGSMFGEEYTLVAVADYVLSENPGPVVSNLSSTQALKDVAGRYGCEYYASAVGEVNVVKKMKEVKAVIGGEGNGGVIYPELHYGRDALVGIALFLTHLVKSGKTAKELRETYPNYVISKNKIELSEGLNVDEILENVKQLYQDFEIDTTDGVKIIMPGEWIHLRKSNTEPIIRIYAESKDETAAQRLAQQMIAKIQDIVNQKV